MKDINWQIRYEKGNFRSGSCLLKSRKTIVINKFVPLEQKIQALLDIISHLTANEEYILQELPPKQLKFIHDLTNRLSDLPHS